MDINQAFKTTFKLLLGAEPQLELDDIAEYLKRWHANPTLVSSSISGKPVSVSSDMYKKNLKFISEDEIDFSKNFKLDINEIKDIDSIVEAIQDRVYYAGNKVLGESKDIENSDNIFNSYYVRNSSNISACKYVAYTSHIRDSSEFIFGCTWFLRSKYLIRCLGADNITRCFETYYSTNSSDLFFCFGCHATTNAMFSFNLRSKRNVIGNLELPKDKYAQLRKKLVDESREYLEKHKDFYSIFDWQKPSQELAIVLKSKVNLPQAKKPKTNFEVIDSAFKSTCKVVLGQEIGSLKEYENYLLEGQQPVQKVDTFFGNKTYFSPFLFFGQIPKSRMLSLEEAEEMGKQHVQIEDSDNLETIMKKIADVAFFRIDLDEGKNENNDYTHVVYHGSHSYKVADITFGKYCAYSTLALNSEYLFGTNWAIHSQFSIKCYNSVNLTRCFELSDCRSCTDSYFCHNSENLNDCMFCFNTKSKRYAIANVEVGKERYMEIKKLVLKEIAAKLEKNKILEWSIFNLSR